VSHDPQRGGVRPSPDRPEPAYFDAMGCLSPSGMAALQAASTGKVPPEIAAHFAQCRRCQERLLLAAAAAEGAGPISRDLSRLRSRVRWVAGIVIALLLLALAVLSALVRQRAG